MSLPISSDVPTLDFDLPLSWYSEPHLVDDISPLHNAMESPKSSSSKKRQTWFEGHQQHGHIQVRTFMPWLGAMDTNAVLVYTEEQMNAVVVAHREAKTMSDKVALLATKVLRFGLDLVTGYKHEHAISLNEKDPEAARKKYAMTEEKYMIRNVFLESVAGVPGMVAGMLRHLHSMRRMKRDNGW